MVTGPLGAGKSFYGIRKACDALEANKFVVTNFAMAPGWTERVANRNAFRWLLGRRRRRLADRWARNFYKVDSLQELIRVRADGQGEGRMVVVIDEAHVFMNARTWRDEDRMRLVEWASASRKLGADVYLITQDLQSLDRQVRDRLTYHVTLRNLKQFKVIGIPVVPFNFFLAIWQYHAAGKAIVKREAYRLNWMAKLYDTHDLGAFASLVEPEDVIRLPLPAPAPPPAATVIASATAAAGGAAPRRDAQEEARRRLMDPDRFLRDDQGLDTDEFAAVDEGPEG
jgi:hypothetical protein